MRKDFANKSQAVAFNVMVLAESLQSRLSGLESELSSLSAEVAWAAARSDMARERAGRRGIRKLCARKPAEE